MPPCIRLDKLTKSYGPTTAVNELTLEINPGEVFGLLGPNGAGKSTTLYMLTGLVRPTSGTVTDGPRETTILTGAPIATNVPGPGFWLMTLPDGTVTLKP